jgi:DNA-binding NarL/FixJ family response regulator
MIRILIVDDHDLVRQGLRALLEPEAGFEVIGEAGDGQEAIRRARDDRPDVILMDLNLPGGLGGLEASEAVLRDHPGVRIIVLTQYEDREYVRRALKIGARGYLPKRCAADELKDAIRTVAAGRRYLHPTAAAELAEMVATGRPLEEDDYEALTPREKQVFKLLAEGKTSRDIGKYLGISLKTAITHRTHVMGKLRVHSRAEVIRYAVRKGIIRIDGAVV